MCSPFDEESTPDVGDADVADGDRDARGPGPADGGPSDAVDATTLLDGPKDAFPTCQYGVGFGANPFGWVAKTTEGTLMFGVTDGGRTAMSAHVNTNNNAVGEATDTRDIPPSSVPKPNQLDVEITAMLTWSGAPLGPLGTVDLFRVQCPSKWAVLGADPKGLFLATDETPAQTVAAIASAWQIFRFSITDQAVKLTIDAQTKSVVTTHIVPAGGAGCSVTLGAAFEAAPSSDVTFQVDRYCEH
jgi:hypothetical protein